MCNYYKQSLHRKTAQCIHDEIVNEGGGLGSRGAIEWPLHLIVILTRIIINIIIHPL